VSYQIVGKLRDRLGSGYDVCTSGRAPDDALAWDYLVLFTVGTQPLGHSPWGRIDWTWQVCRGERTLQIQNLIIQLPGIGLGTALLSFVEELAATHQCSRITGEIVHQDVEQYSDLPGWYTRRGYTLQEASEHGHVRARFWKELSPKRTVRNE